MDILKLFDKSEIRNSSENTKDQNNQSTKSTHLLREKSAASDNSHTNEEDNFFDFKRITPNSYFNN